MKKYITISNPTGAVFGVNNEPVSTNMQILVENGSLYGIESALRIMDHATLIQLTTTAIGSPAGTSGICCGFGWTVGEVA